MKRNFKSLLIALVVVLALGVGATAAITQYKLDKTVPATLSVTEKVTVVNVELFSSLLGAPLSGPIVFTADEGGTAVAAVYFDARQIAPSSIAVSATCAGGTFNYTVGTPSQSTGYCPIALYITNCVPGAFNFNIGVTGHS